MTWLAGYLGFETWLLTLMRRAVSGCGCEKSSRGKLAEPTLRVQVRARSTFRFRTRAMPLVWLRLPASFFQSFPLDEVRFLKSTAHAVSRSIVMQAIQMFAVERARSSSALADPRTRGASRHRAARYLLHSTHVTASTFVMPCYLPVDSRVNTN